MAGMRMSMRKIREVLRLTHELGLSVRQESLLWLLDFELMIDQYFTFRRDRT
jgi:hypothetical protein